QRQRQKAVHQTATDQTGQVLEDPYDVQINPYFESTFYVDSEIM
ncbi:22326_t:CDS:1, partial [Gigaspora margarita]